MPNLYRIPVFVFFIVCTSAVLFAESLDTQSNQVDNGAISVAAEDTDRSDWDGIPWYEYDDDFSDMYPVDIDRVQIAHDATHVYFHLQALEWDTEETWRVGTYIDTDRDITTGYTGNFLPLGADFFMEEALAFEFNAATQADWGKQIFSELAEIAKLMDSALETPRYLATCQQLVTWFDKPELTYSARILKQTLDNQSISKIGRELAKQYQDFFANQGYSFFSQQDFEQEATASFERQQQIEAKDDISFDDYLAKRQQLRTC